jgi:hypothetical protein
MSMGYALTVNKLNGTTGSELEGAAQRTITDDDQAQLGLTETALKKVIKDLEDYEPESAYLHSPAPSQYAGDMYDKYHWNEAKLRVRPVKVVFDEPSDSKEEKIAVVEHFRNDSGTPAKYHSEATAEYTSTLENSWANTNTVKWDLTVDASLKIVGTGVGVSTTIGYQHDWTHTKTQSFSYKFGVSAGVEVKLDPGQAVDVLIYGTVAQYTAHVTYLVDLAEGGDCAYCWGEDDWHNGHHDWARDAASVAGHLASFPQEVTEVVKFGFASDGTVKVVDAPSGAVLGEQSFNVVPAENLPLRIDARPA